MTLSLALRVAALVSFVLALVGLHVGLDLVVLGLALWCGSTLVK